MEVAEKTRLRPPEEPGRLGTGAGRTRKQFLGLRHTAFGGRQPSRPLEDARFAVSPASVPQLLATSSPEL